MGLRVWLPLNGSLENQGLSGTTFQNLNSTYTTFNTAGKIGNCMNTDAPSWNRGGLLSYETINLGTQQSMFCWFKFTTLCLSSTLGGGLVTQHRYQNNTGMGITIRPTNNTAGYLSVNTGTGSDRTYNTYYGTTLLQAGTWYHGGYTYDGTTIRIYVNGVCEKEQVLTGMSTPADYLGIGLWSLGGTSGRSAYTSSYVFNGSLNDVRIYDHALSVKEVRELARGLMVHYKLDMDQSTEPTTNLGGTSINYSNMTYGNAYGASTWGGDAGTVTYYATGGFNNGPYKVYHKTATGTGGIYKKTANDITITSGKTYTVSAYIKASRSFTESHYGFNINGVAGSDSNHYITSGVSLSITTEWKRFSFTFTATDADAGTYGEMSIIYNDQVADYYVYYSCFQIEEKDHVTDFTLSSRPLKVMDVSGFHYHGTPMNTLTLVDDTPRYSHSISFPGTSYIYRTSPSAQAMTISLWAKWNSIPSGQSVIYVDYKSKTGLGLMSAGILCSSSSLNSYTFSKANIVANTWYHFVIVCPSGSSNAARDLYINGVKQTATTSQSNWSYAIDELQLGKRSTTSDGFNGKLSDFRIYATALSDADIMDLYHTSAEIDRNGNYYLREVIEK